MMDEKVFQKRVAAARDEFMEKGIPLGRFMEYCFNHRLNVPPGVGVGAMTERVPVAVFLATVGMGR